MKEVQAIIEAFNRDNRIAALATVIEVRGSTYRRPGARMLMTQSGYIGSISGGCLEADVFEHAQQVMALGEPMVVKYDTTSPDDIVWGLGLGCNGLVRVFIERLTPQKRSHSVAFLAECYQDQQMGVLATVVRGADLVLGTHLMLQQDGKVRNYIEDSALAASVLEDAHACLLYTSPSPRDS